MIGLEQRRSSAELFRLFLWTLPRFGLWLLRLWLAPHMLLQFHMISLPRYPLHLLGVVEAAKLPGLGAILCLIQVGSRRELFPNPSRCPGSGDSPLAQPHSCPGLSGSRQACVGCSWHSLERHRSLVVKLLLLRLPDHPMKHWPRLARQLASGQTLDPGSLPSTLAWITYRATVGPLIWSYYRWAWHYLETLARQHP